MHMKPPIGATLDKSHPLADGLVGAWLMNEGGGLVAHDLSGNGNDGTFGGNVDWDYDYTDLPGGGGDFVQMNKQVDWSSGFSAVVLCRMDAPKNCGLCTDMDQANFKSKGACLALRSARSIWVLIGDRVVAETSTLYPLGKWFFVAATWAPGGSGHIYRWC